MGLIIETTLGTESQIGLVDEGRGLQSLSGMQSRARPAGGPFQLLVKNRHQLGRHPLDFRGLRAALREHGAAGFCLFFGLHEDEFSADSRAVARSWRVIPPVSVISGAAHSFRPLWP